MKNIKNIILDYGNVIFDLDFQRAHKSFEEIGIKDVNRFFSHKVQSSLFDDFDKGKISADDFRNTIRVLTNRNDLTDEQIDYSWNSLLIGVPQARHELLIQLKSRYRTFLLSNNNELHYDWIMQYLKNEYQLDGNKIFFEKDYYSHLLGMRKPDEEIFDFVISTNGLKPNETLFVDDSPQHLETADRMGIQTILATPQNTFEKIVQEIGLF